MNFHKNFLTRTASGALGAILLASVTSPIAFAETDAALAATAPAQPPTETAAAAGGNSAAASAATSPADNTIIVPATDGATPVVKWKPGQTLSTNTDTEDIIATYDIDLAKRQVAAYADSPEAAFILAVALTRTSRVEEALKAVQHARRLAEAKGGPVYFDKMIAAYEQMLTAYPDDNRVRYHLSWAYYMKAYLLAQYSRKSAHWKAVQLELQAQAKGADKQPTANKTAGSNQTASKTDKLAATASGAAAKPDATPKVDNAAVVQFLTGSGKNKDLASNLANLAGVVSSLSQNQAPPLASIPHIPGALEKAEPADIPQIRKFYELALQKLDELLKKEPDDIWATVYRAHLQAEYTGNLEQAMVTWKQVQQKYPNNPASYFFLGEGYLKQGNLRESINHVSKAIALRALGN